MPSGPAVTAVGPWVADSARPTCVECHTQFGFFTRRHHCRRCGEIFCAKCSKYSSKDIPGLTQFHSTALRVCKCCFLRHLAFMVVARKAFGVKFELFGSQADATAFYNKCKRSRMMVRMANSQVVVSSYESETVRQRLVHKAMGARNFLLGGHQVAEALVRDPLDHSRISFAADSPTRTVAGAWCIVFAVQFQNETDWRYTTLEMRTGDERQNVIAAFVDSCKANKDVAKAVALNLRGLTVLTAYSAGTFSRTAVVVSEAQSYIRRQPCMLVLHIGGHCTTRVCPSVTNGLESVDQLPPDVSAILMLPNFEVLARHRCDIASFRDELMHHAGLALLHSMHETTRVAVVSERDVVTVCGNMNTAVAAADTEQRARGGVVAVVGLASEAPFRAATGDSAAGDRTPSDVGRDAPPSSAAELKLLYTAGGAPQHRVRRTLSVLSDARIAQVSRALVDSVRNASRPMSRDDVAVDAAAVTTTPGRAGETLDARRAGMSPPPEVISCSICMEDYNTADRRPVMCVSCGNTICHGCWQQTRSCPMCRVERQANPVFNIALLALLEAPDTTPNSL